MLRSPLSAAGLALGLFAATASAQLGAPFEPEMLDLADASLQSLELPAAPIEAFDVAVALGGETYTLDLELHSVRSDGFQVLVQGTGGYLPHESAPVRTYRGDAGVPGSMVAASLRDDGLHALVRLDGAGVFAIQPAPGGGGAHAVYATSDTLPQDVSCGLPHTAPVARHQHPASSGADGGTKDVVEIAVDSDNQFFLDQGSSVEATQDEIESILNAVEAIYDTQLDVQFQLTVIIVRTSEPDPYTGDIFTRLDQQLNLWNNELVAVPRDICAMFTGLGVDSGVIGVAYLDAVCELDFGYGINDVEWTDNFGLKVTLVAHELGHNFGSNHCDGTSDCKIMCSFIAGCDPDTSGFGSFALGEISSFVAGLDCTSQPGGCGYVSYGLSEGNAGALAAFGPATPGSNMTLVYANASAAPSSALAAISGNQASVPYGPGIALINLSTILVVTPGVNFNATDEAEVENVAIPAIPALVGAVFYTQAAFVVGGGIDRLSNGVQITICP